MSMFAEILVLEGLIQNFTILLTQHLGTVFTAALYTCSIY